MNVRKIRFNYNLYFGQYVFLYQFNIFAFLFFYLKRRPLWHRTCFQKLCQPTELIKDFTNIIPNNIPEEFKFSSKFFTRDRDLPAHKLIALTLSLVANGSDQGLDIKSNLFFKNAQRTGLWPDANSVHRSSITKARAKLKWQIFQNILDDSVKLAYRLWPTNDSRYLWHNMSVFALDGSMYNLPATDVIRHLLDPKSGLEYKGKGHYPQCLVSTVYDVFRRLPIARTVVNANGSERQEMKNLTPFVPPNSVWLFDRGYPGYDPINHLEHSYDGFYIFRSPGKSTFAPVKKFLQSGLKEDSIWLLPSNELRRRVSFQQKRQLKPIKLRVIRMDSPDGTVSVLLTNLFGKNKYPYKQLIDLYFRRWEVENYYRDEKITLHIEKFRPVQLDKSIIIRGLL